MVVSRKRDRRGEQQYRQCILTGIEVDIRRAKSRGNVDGAMDRRTSRSGAGLRSDRGGGGRRHGRIGGLPRGNGGDQLRDDDSRDDASDCGIAIADGNDGGRGRRVCKTECVVDDLSNARAGDGDQNDRICIAGDCAIGDGVFACAVERDDGRLDGCVYETRSGDSDGAGARINQHVSNDRVGNAECGGVGGIVYLQSVGRGVGSDSGDSGGGVFDLQQLGSTRAVLRRDNESAEFGDRRGICPDRAGDRAIGHGMDGNDVGV